MHYLIISNLVVDVIRKNTQTLHLAVSPPDARVRVTAPLSIDEETIQQFVNNKLAWINKQQAKHYAQTLKIEKAYTSGQGVYFQGKRYLLNIIHHQYGPKIEIENDTILNLYVRKRSTAQHRNKAILTWYREQLKELIPPFIKKWEAITTLSINEWHIKHLKTKWGATNIKDKRMWLNLELAQKPSYCLEYVILHELTHLLERHHSHRFIAHLDKFMPNWRFHKAELNHYPLNYLDRDY